MAVDPNEFELVEAWCSGDVASGERLFERYFEPLYWFFSNKAPLAAEELVQRTLLACAEARRRIDPARSFRAYLYTIARRKLADYFAEVRRAPVDLGAVSPFDLDPTPGTVIGTNQQHARLLAGLRRLPFDMQILLELFYWEDLSGAELAEVLGVPEGTVRTRIRRARELLRAALELPASSHRIDFDAWAREVAR